MLVDHGCVLVYKGHKLQSGKTSNRSAYYFASYDTGSNSALQVL